MTNNVLIARVQRTGYLNLSGGLLGALRDGRYIPNIPDGVLDGLLKRIGDAATAGQVSPYAPVLAEVDTATRAYVQTLVRADLLGTDVAPLVRDYFEGCGNEAWPLPRKWFKPTGLLPFAGRVDDSGKAQPEPWLTQQMQVVAALALTDLGDQLDSNLGTTLVDGAAQLLDIATTTR